MLRGTIFNEVWLYGTGVIQRTHLGWFSVKSSRWCLSSTDNQLKSFPSPPPRAPCGFNCFRRWQICREKRVLGFGSCGSKFGENRPLFIGLLVWTRRGLGVLQFLSIHQTLIQLHLEVFWKGNELGFVTIRKPNFRLG
jgi:hypothetical protein